MAIVKLKIDVGGTIGHEAWYGLTPFAENQGSFFGPEFGASGECKHPANIPHPKGEWIGAEVLVASHLLAEYAMSHYLEQERVLDVDIEE